MCARQRVRAAALFPLELHPIILSAPSLGVQLLHYDHRV